jgi:hypothetical protein
MKVKQVTCNNGTTEYHTESCNHTSYYADGSYIMEFNASNMKELKHEINIDFNKDFASDYGLTPEEYVASGEGYQASTKAGSDVRIFSCIKF